MSTLATPTIDVRSLAPAQRHPLIFATFDGLAVGDAFELVNDHDPVPLFMQFARLRGGQFDWRYLQSGPDLWQVRIARTQLAPAGVAPRPEGGCGGGGGGCGCRG